MRRTFGSVRPVTAVVGVVLLATATLAFSACGDDDTTSADPSSSGSSGTYDEALGTEVVEHYADGVFSSYNQSFNTATEMRTAILAFVAAPADATLAAARTAWIDARDDYGVTEAFRFYGGPIDDEQDGPEGQINAWPLDEAYIDYVDGDASAGIVNDVTGVPEISAEVLIDANEKDGETNISTGWHAIEFLLWGQDLSATGPGARPATDYTTAPNAQRRATYLTVVTDQLIDDLTGLVEAWDPDGDDNYRSTFLAQDTDKSLTDIITGIGELSRGELAGERMTVAYEERDQENEHSCFSDNTTSDLIANQQGIENVWTGTYPGGVEGKGLDELVESVDEELAATTTTDMAASMDEIEKIPAPFDQSLTEDASDDAPGRTAILAATTNLSTQTDDLVASADALGLTIEVS